MSPDVLHRVELWSVGGQVLKLDRTTLSLDIVAYQARSMRGETIPDDQELATDVRLQSFEELDNLRALDRSGEQSEVEAPEAHPSDHRQLLPSEAVLQDRCLASGRPSSRAAGTFGQTRLVDEDDHSSLPRSAFF